ncbi:MAG: FAD-dependent monooxygenase [Planctomycetes bacterium]|nr:FAD-dependent monooxygenase [Planctomycetota bacterium]
MEKRETDVCIAGGGPAGMLAGLLLARLGVKVLVLEQHADFEREYRGEVLMPRFIQLMKQVQLFEAVDALPHTRIAGMVLWRNDTLLARVEMARFSPGVPFAYWIPQPPLLRGLHEIAKRYPSFDLWFGADARELLRDGSGAVAGVRGKKGGADFEVRARVTVAADGRTSRLRREAKSEMAYEFYDFDVLWFSLPRPPEFEQTVHFHLTPAWSYLVAPKHPDLIQIGLMAKPGQFARMRSAGIEALRASLARGGALLAGFARQVQDFQAFHPLQARVALAKQWAQDGFLLIGDAAHTCSPAGAIGVSIAVETAAVAAGVIAKALQSGDCSANALGEVQRIRDGAVRGIHDRQRRLAALMLSPNPLVKFLQPVLLPIAAKLGLPQRLPAGMLVADPPVPLDPIVMKG